MSLSYEQAVTRLLSLADFERKARAGDSPDFHLKRTGMLLDALGNPHSRVPAIHVAGSKGKGSTCALIAAGLTACGVRTGMFSSPHLHKMTERFAIDGVPVSELQFVRLFERIWPIAEQIRQHGGCGMVSVFEFQTALAFLHFAEQQADAMVIEVGLGGRLDSTNVITPAVSVITPVGMDHVAVLGDTLAKIAAEKAGIIKRGVPVVVAPQLPEADEVISEAVEQCEARLIQSTCVKVESSEPNGAGPQLLRLRSPRSVYEIRLPLLGAHQLVNVSTAIAAIEAFGDRTASIDAARVSKGISRVRWPGRVQVVEHGPPLLIADGAHNHDSAVALRAAISRHFVEPERPVLILGATGGHEPLAVARVFADLSPRIIVTRSRHPKAVKPADFASALEQDKIAVEDITETTHDALEIARRAASPVGAIIAAGSLFVAAEVIESVTGIEPEIYPDLRGPAGPLRLMPQKIAPAPQR